MRAAGAAVAVLVTLAWLRSTGVGAEIDLRLAKAAEFRARDFAGKTPQLDPRLKIFAYDDKAVTQLQRTELHLDEFRRVFEVLARSKPALIVVDKMFSIENDPDQSVPRFVETAQRLPIAIGAMIKADEIPYRAKLDAKYLLTRDDGFPVTPEAGKHVYGPAARLATTFERVGHIVYPGDWKFAPLVKIGESEYLPHLSRVAGGNPVPTGSDGHAPIDFVQPDSFWNAGKRIATLLDLEKSGKAHKALSPGDVVLLLPGMYSGGTDFFHTPFGLMPGGYLLASTINSNLQGRFIRQFDGLPFLFLGALIGLALGLFLPASAFWPSLLTTALLTSGAGLASFSHFDVAWPWLWQTSAMLGSGLTAFAEKVRVERLAARRNDEEKRRIRSLFTHYLNADVVESLMSDPEKLALGGERRDLSVLFSDVRGFTTISEGLTPEALCHLMNEYFTAMTGLILGSQGVLDKFIGDAVMAFWGAPVALPDHADRAVDSAVRMLFEVDRLKAEFKQKGLPLIEIGIGISSGPMSVGNMGSSDRFCYTVMGDAVNLGARIEGLTKEYGVKLLVTDHTVKKLTPGKYATRNIDCIRVKGKLQAETIHQVLRPDHLVRDYLIRDLVQEFEEARRLYTARNWAQATRHFENCLKLDPGDGPTKLYLERMEELKRQPLDDKWDGVYTFHHK